MKEKKRYLLPPKLIQLSEGTNWDDAKKEWELDYSEKEQDFLRCLCGHPIKEIIHIQNVKNHKRVMIGNCCEKVLFGESSQLSFFQAIRKGKINEEVIDMGLKKGVLTPKERNFAMDVWRKRSMSQKQRNWFEAIKKKLITEFIKSRPITTLLF